MSLIFFDGFETYATADILKEWNSTTGLFSISATGGRRGGGALLAPNSSSFGWASKTLPGNYSTLIVGFSFNPSTMPSLSNSILRLMDGGTQQLELGVNPAGNVFVSRNGTVLGTSTAVLAAAEQYLELKATMHDTTGAFDVRLNGINILSASNVDTKNTANAFVNQVALGVPGNTGLSTIFKYDDFYLLDTTGPAPNNDFLGDVRIDAVYPSADGNYTDWTPSTGTSHYALVDDPTPNTTDYNASNVIGQKDSYVMGDPPSLASQIIYGVRVKVAALKDDAGSRSLKVGIRSGTTDSLGAAQALSTSQIYYSSIHEVDPNTGAAWTPAAVNAMEVVIESA
ncbi:hypothetical protein [Nitrosomonas communis]|uniref:Uncharacterized protein n=1 Tax=Nitrosomonas communis TaxID=44574 RepID=A0A1I4NBN9_9PROT|nr:hypothetical protein [Nitrosomonas communis]SFM12805.1 hypothetical protein SAMN05421863_101425 [Nitrosomonas communis]